ncbi:MAG: GNAT family N-acetyltransferase [Myxococcales bacterium]|nr:GNAT family N-acetyltransferase [Myxococcales bacterium]
MSAPSEAWLAYLGEPIPWRPPSPLPRTTTARLVVRPYARGDGPALFAAIDRSRAGLLPWMLWASTDHRHVEDSIHYVERHRRAYGTSSCRDYPLGIFDRTSGELVGSTGLHDVRVGTRQAEVGWWVAPSHQGKGIATEAIDGLVETAFQPVDQGGWGLRRLVVYVVTDNHPSRRVAEKVGLRLEGTLRAERFIGYPPDAPRGYVDVLAYALLAGEPRARAAP